MSILDSRLNRLIPTLTATERAVLVLRALKEKREEDPSWRATMPPDQTRVFSNLIGLMNACNIQVAAAILVLELKVDAVWTKALWAACMSVLAEGRRPRKRLRVVDALPAQLYKAIALESAAAWRELRALEILIDELTEEFGGEQPLRPVDEQSLLNSKERILALGEGSGVDLDLPEPTEEDVEHLREAVKKWAGF